MAELAYIDFETRSVLDVTKVGAVHYSEHISTEIQCLCYALDDGPVKLWHRKYPDLFMEETPLPEDLFDHILVDEGLVEAHNAGFERAIWENIASRYMGWPEIHPNQWRCSAAKAAVMALPRSLEDVTNALDLPVKKDMEGNRIMKKLAKARKVTIKNKSVFHESVEDLETLWAYCADDVKAERYLSKMLPDLIPSEQELWFIDQEMNFLGITVDRDFVDACLIHQERNVNILTEELIEITHGVVDAVTKRQKFVDWVKTQGFFLENTQAEYLKALLENSKPKNEKEANVFRAVQIMKECGKTSISKYISMKKRICDDGRLRDNLVFHGARPGRWAGKGTQLQNLPRGSIVNMDQTCIDLKNDTTEIIQLMYGPIPDILSQALRGALTATDGWELYVADFNAIEARTEFWLVDDEETLEDFRTGIDIYKAMASVIYGVPIYQVTKNQRFIGKQAILGLGYQMWADKFCATCLDAGKQFGISVEIDPEFAKGVVLSYRKKYYKIVQFWGALENGFRFALKNKGTYYTVGKVQFSCGEKFLRIKLPSGRFISYYKPWLVEERTFRGLEEKIYYWGQDPTTHTWQATPTFGGKIAENVTQGIARDFMVHGMKAIHQTKRYPLLLTVHDEIIAEGRKHNTTLEEFCSLMSSIPYWSPGMPIKVEGWKGFRYKK
jgi:DNA polymerase